ncbi:MAG: bacillithiol biosynthesis BshC, partial [Flavobacteriales bacterium]|nr:bacillithiol biosynthesis BshC [Flavobacteriales bacterium]
MVHRIPYRDTHRFADVVLDHLDDAPALRELRTFPPSWEGLDAAAKDRTFPQEHRATLVEALRRQYAGLELGEAVEANLAKLADPRSLTVTTGHQLVLFGGPLYVPFKLLNVVRLARDLEARW